MRRLDAPQLNLRPTYVASEVELRAHLRNPALHDDLRVPPVRVEVAFGQDRVAIERVEQIEIHGRARPSEAEHFADAEIELIQPLSVQRPRLEDVDVRRQGAGREVPTQAGSDLGIRVAAD